MSGLYTKSLTQVLPSCSISLLILSGYFSLVFGGLMISIGGVVVYQALRSTNQHKLEETVIATAKQLNRL